jgi:hypothetical protein
MERFKGYQEDQGSRCKPSWLLPSVQDRTGEAGGHGVQIAGGSSELGLRQGAHGVEEVWGTTWGVLTDGGCGRRREESEGAAGGAGGRLGVDTGGSAAGVDSRRGWRWSCSLALWTSLRRRPAPDASLGGEPDGGNADNARLLAPLCGGARLHGGLGRAASAMPLLK